MRMPAALLDAHAVTFQVAADQLAEHLPMLRGEAATKARERMRWYRIASVKGLDAALPIKPLWAWQ